VTPSRLLTSQNPSVSGLRGAPLETSHISRASVGVAGFEPTTSCSQIPDDDVGDGVNRLQVAETIDGPGPSAVQEFQALAPVRRPFVPSRVPGRRRGRLAVLRALHGRLRLLTVAEVARAFAVSRATVYALCAAGRIPNVRILNQVRIPPAALARVLAGHGPSILNRRD
jgi:excisionase family DNA binding protein